MQIIEVTTPILEKKFIEVNVHLYANDPNYIRPLNHEILDIFDKRKNKLLNNGNAKRWLLKDEAGEYIGRIAAFLNPHYTNKGDTLKTGGIGFFDCINNQQAAILLFDTAKNWFEELGVEAMDGPINFGERDKWWGLLIDGFHSPLYGMNYNAPYYQKLFEQYGFKTFYNQFCWHLRVDTRLPEKFYAAHQKHCDNKDIHAERVNRRHLDKYARDFSHIYNRAWAQHEGNKQISPEKAIGLFNKMKPILDRDIMWFTYHKNEPVAVWLNIPDLNQIFRHFNGKFSVLEKIKLLWYRYTGKCNRFVGIVYGIVPEWQGSGIDYYMIVEASKIIQSKNKYTELELQWQGDFNPKMLAISKQLGCSQSRKLATFRYLFDQSKVFERHPMLH
ncbi:MAG: hypothetical protein H0V61_10040 [Chitinophagales bacterium]|nr:hypothetical protein [Chitinophagales bacterium]